MALKPDAPAPPSQGLEPDVQELDPLSQKMWGGRFEAKADDIVSEINLSLPIDKKLWQEDIDGSRAHAAMLARQGIISQDDEAGIQNGLSQIEKEMLEERFPFQNAYEDIHMNIEARLSELIGPAAGRLHTARSRNDQVAVDFRLWIRKACDRTRQQINALQKALVLRAETETETLMPGFTHLQPAQSVTLAHHLMAYVEMFGRDVGRFSDARSRLNECPLGAAALAGSPFPIDRDFVAQSLGFSRPTANSLDSVADRDFALEVLSAATLTGLHLSRLAEELILWTTPQFNFVRLSDRFTTGSSIMPQKRNPDAAELIRAKVGRIFADMTGLVITMKALPLAYSKDMQEDKAFVFEAFEALELSLVAMRGMILDLVPNRKALRDATQNGYITATDLADWLVRTHNIPFRQAHHITGRLVKRAETLACDLADLPLSEFQAIAPMISEDVFSVLTVEKSVASRTSYGGTAPSLVHNQILIWKEKLANFNLEGKMSK